MMTEHSEKQDPTQDASQEAGPSANVDPSEVDKFNQLARKWWDKNSEFKPLHDINPLRVEYITDKLNLDNLDELDKLKVLDVGCGGGILSESLAEQGAKVTALDKAEMALKVARLHALENNVEIDYQQKTVEEFSEGFAAEADQKFDVITCMEMLEHVPDPDSIIKSCGQLLKPGGHLFLSTINRNPKSYLLAIVGAEYVLNMLPKGTHDYGKLIKPAELARSLRQYHFRLTDISGMTYNPLTGKYKISRDTDVNYLVSAVYEPFE